MPVTQKLACVVEQVVAHGERVYTLALRPERLVPRFRAGQFLHLALDPYDPSGFWPESRVFSIASPPAQRDTVRITYAVHGRFTARMESDLVEGRQVWIKMPYGDFVVDRRRGRRAVRRRHRHHGVHGVSRGADARGTPGRSRWRTARAPDGLLIYRDLVERCALRLPSLDVSYFVEHGAEAIRSDSTDVCARCRAECRSRRSGRGSRRPFETATTSPGRRRC